MLTFSQNHMMCIINSIASILVLLVIASMWLMFCLYCNFNIFEKSYRWTYSGRTHSNSQIYASGPATSKSIEKLWMKRTLYWQSITRDKKIQSYTNLKFASWNIKITECFSSKTQICRRHTLWGSSTPDNYKTCQSSKDGWR